MTPIVFVDVGQVAGFVADKSEAVRQAVEGPVTAMMPASAIQRHDDVLVVLDEPAASTLSMSGSS